MMSKLNRTALFAAASSLALGATAQAQVFEQVGGGDRRTVDVITVTAQQREESVQDVPISIGAYDEIALQNAGVKDIKDLISIAPGLMVTSTQSETITTARIRGIGTVGDNFGLESSVGVYIDGVFRSRNGVGFGDLGEIERIEVLRGPQGTLFGKNTSAGVLSVTTMAPEFEPGGSVELQAGDYGFVRASAGYTAPLIEDVLAFRIFGVKGERDGFTQLEIERDGDVSVGESETQDYYSFRGQLLWTPSEEVQGRIIMDYTDRSELCCSAVQWDYTAAAAGLVAAVGGRAFATADPDSRYAFANEAYAQNVTDSGISAEFDFEMPIGTLTSVTAYRSWESSRSQDVDYTSASLAYRDEANNFTDLTRISQELRLTGVHGNLDWLVGAFYSFEDLELGDAIRLGNDWEPFLSLAVSGALGAPSVTFIPDTLNSIAGAPLFSLGTAIPADAGPVQDLYDQTSSSWALFTHNAYSLTDDLTLTAGLRYTRETKDVFATFSTGNSPGCGFLESAFGFDPVGAAAQSPTTAPLIPIIARVCLPYNRTGLDANGYDRERKDEEVSGTIRLTYDVNDDVMVYGGYSRGFKAGGFNLDRQLNGPIDPATGYTDSDSSFAPEIIDSYEVGFKSQIFNGVMLLNGSFFYQQIEDYQLNTFNGLAFVVESIEESESMGVEIDLAYATPIPGLDINAGYAFVDTEYTSTNTGDPLVDAIEGQNFSLSPEHFFTSQVNYERSIFSDYLLRMSTDVRWVSEYNTGSDLDPEKEQDAFALWNARIGVGPEDGSWAFEVWGRNLTDETYAQVAFDGFAQGGRGGSGTSLDPRGTQGYQAFLGAPRTWGVTLRKEW